jgi:diguanylate cyclase (GGDEF)-like protein
MPPDGEQFAIATGVPPTPPYFFHVVELPQPVALVSLFDRPPLGTQGMGQIEALLSKHGLVAFVGPGCEGAEVVRTRQARASALEVASATAALKTLGGWEEPVPIVINVDLQIVAVWLESLPWRAHAKKIDAQGLTEAMGALLEAGRSFSFAHININHFRPYNDAYGPAMGDLLLARLHGVIQRGTDQTVNRLFRRGIDDLVLLPGEPDPAVEWGERLCGAVDEQYLPLEHPELSHLRQVTVSMGIIHVSDQSGGTPEDVERAANDVLHRAKRGVYERTWDGRSLARVEHFGEKSEAT